MKAKELSWWYSIKKEIYIYIYILLRNIPSTKDYIATPSSCSTYVQYIHSIHAVQYIREIIEARMPHQSDELSNKQPLLVPPGPAEVIWWPHK